MKTIVSITYNARCCAAIDYNTCTHNTTVTNNTVSTSAKMIIHEVTSCNVAVSIGRTRSGVIMVLY